MKTLTRFALTVSLVLNAALITVLVLGSRTDAPDAASLAPGPALLKPAEPEIDANVWPSLHASADLPALVTRLREAGFPPAVVRAIVSAQLQEQFAARRRALDPAGESRPFWKSVASDPRLEAALRQLSRDQQQALRELLGSDADSDHPIMRMQEMRTFGHLPQEKREQARRITAEFNDRRSDIFAAVSGGGAISFTPAMREQIDALETQMRAELRSLMTPPEFEEYDLRGSNTANSLRHQLAAFEATEAEFRLLFKLQREFEERFPPGFGPMSPEMSRSRGEAHRQLTEQIKAALGPVRGAEYERATNHDYRTTSLLVGRLGLPPETTNQIWSIRTDIEKRAQELRQNPAQPPDGRRAEQLGSLQAQAVADLTQLLGARGMEAYKQYSGRWIEHLVPRPSGTPVPAQLRLGP
jgi:hypothetical protein